MSFDRDWSRIEAKTIRKMDVAVRRIGAGLLGRVVNMSPVKEGRFRGNWQVAVNSVPTGFTDSVDKSGTMTIQTGIGNMGGALGGTLYIVNNLPYSVRLEMGHSGQAPHGMVRLTVLEYEPLVRKVAQELSRE